MTKPVLYIPIGLPGAGKTSYFKKVEGETAVSSDGIRKEFFGDEGRQFDDAFLASRGFPVETMSDNEKRLKCNIIVFQEVDERIDALLRDGKDAVYDGTNLEKKYRDLSISRFSPLATIYGVYFNVPIDLCIERDQKRTSHTVGEARIREMAKTLDCPEMAEGFDILETIDGFGTRLSILYRDESD